MTSTLPSPSAGNPWREYAEHLEHCATCAEDGVNACHEGRPLQAAALTSASKQEGGEPSDAQLLDLSDDFKSTYQHGGTTFDDFDAVGFARAVLELAAPQTQQAETGEAETVTALAKRLYAEHPTFRGDKPLDWYSTPKAARREWLDKATALKAVQPSQRNGGCGNGESHE